MPAFLAVLAIALIVGSLIGPNLLLAAGIVCATAAALALFKEFQDRRKSTSHDEFGAGRVRTQFTRDLQAQAAQEAAVWRSAWPSIPALHRAYTYGTPAVVSPGRAGEVVLGYGTASWNPIVESSGELDEALRDEVARWAQLSNVPISGSLCSSSIGIYAADVGMAASVARALVAQAVGLYPDDVALATRLDAEGLARWDWLKWSTHLVVDELLLKGTLVVIDTDDISESIATPKDVFGPIVVCRTEAELERCDLQMRIAPNGTAMLNRAGQVSPMILNPHTVSVPGASALARAMLAGDLIEMGEQPDERRAGVRPYLLRERIE